MNRKGGSRRKTRQKMTQEKSKKGKINIKQLLKTFKVGDKVQLVANPTQQKKGLFNLRFHGKHGVIKAKQGKAYQVTIKDHTKEKVMIAHSVHLKKI